MVDLSAAAWENKYKAGQDLWDLGCPAPPFIKLLASAQAPKLGRIAVLGCGNGQDAMLFATAGFNVVGFDFAPSAIKFARESAKARGLTMQFFQRDIFELETEFRSGFDYVLEHSCFCAIEPTLRPQYIQVVKTLLRPGGKFIALFYVHKPCSEKPPFGIKPQAILDSFSPYFDIISFTATKNSISRHRGKEYLAIFQVKPY